jgi:hypothetical protein
MVFKNKTKNKTDKDPVQQEALEKIAHDLIVHNMPSREKISGTIVNPKSAGKIDIASAPKKSNFKAVGVVIMVGGLIFIAAIVYLTYRFVISPTANKNKVLPVPVATSENSASSSQETAGPVASSSTALTEEAIKISTDASSSTASSSQEEVMPEGSDGKDLSNLPPLVDTDADKLLDEEESLLGTSINLSDSDGDSYLDVAEIESGYNPAGSGLLKDNTLLSTYQNKNYAYSVLYPKSWLLNETNANLTVLTAADDSLIQISVLKNDAGLSILSWYEDSFPNDNISYDNVITKDGFEAVRSPDSLNVYLTEESRKNIFIISYIPASATRLAYPNIFKLLVNSFKFK